MEDESSPSPTEEVDGEVEEVAEEVVEVTTNPVKGAATRSSSTNPRSTWMKLTATRVVDGQTIVVYPWLQDESNSKDRAFIRLLSLYRPYKVKYGQRDASWKKLEERIGSEQDVSGNRCFPKTPCVRSLRDRFRDYMSFAKKFHQSVALRSGCDDEIQHELLDQLIKLHSDYELYLSEAEKFSNQPKQSADAAAAMRSAAVGRRKKRKHQETLFSLDSDPTDTDENSKPVSSSKSMKKRKAFNATTDFADIISVREERLRFKAETKLEELKIKKELIEFKKKHADENLKIKNNILIAKQKLQEEELSIRREELRIREMEVRNMHEIMMQLMRSHKRKKTRKESSDESGEE